MKKQAFPMEMPAFLSVSYEPSREEATPVK